MEVYFKLLPNFHRHQRKFPLNFLQTSPDARDRQRKFRGTLVETSSKLPLRNFGFGLLILTLAAKFAHEGKPNFYFEAKILALQFDFEGKAKTGKVKIFSFGFEVNFLASLVYWVF